ncbi:MAG TPA: alpha/beta fold hydrolase [Gemmataceae bacterium]|jgi:alpha-beta hydrolase superfamily lysophospholipase|nr:alpha/beta fold hydrolase [Gemmataceae bacterium]
MNAHKVGEYSTEEHQAGDGYRWRYRRYIPAEPVKARVIGVHGIQSHGGWYENSCRYLSGAGFEVCFLDRRGAGLNQESRGDTPSFRRLLDDLAEFIQAEVKRHDSGLPTFFMAISWGGKLAIGLERRHPGLVDGLALLCPGFFPKVRPSLREGLGIALARLFSPRKLFPVPLNDPELFTANPRWQKFIQEDAHGLRQATARLLVESVRLGAYVRLSSVKIPMLLLLAENDRIIDNARTRCFVEGFDSVDKKIIQYPGAHHTLEFEPNPEMFLRDLLNWFQDHIATKP